MVSKALALQISNKTSPPVKTLISISRGVVPSVSFPMSPTTKGSESLDEVIAVIPSGLYIYEFSHIVCCLIDVSQVEIVGMLLMSTRNLAEWENILF
jgi:hypothetical protein